MKQKLLTLAAAAAIALSMAGSASASELPGTPGEKNCHGQTVRYLTQAGSDILEMPEYNGLGNLVDYYEGVIGADFSVKEIQDLAAEYCALAP